MTNSNGAFHAAVQQDVVAVVGVVVAEHVAAVGVVAAGHVAVVGVVAVEHVAVVGVVAAEHAVVVDAVVAGRVAVVGVAAVDVVVAVEHAVAAVPGLPVALNDCCLPYSQQRWLDAHDWRLQTGRGFYLPPAGDLIAHLWAVRAFHALPALPADVALPQHHLFRHYNSRDYYFCY